MDEHGVHVGCPDGGTVPVRDGGVDVGRDAVNDVVVESERASRRHARFEPRDGHVVVRDLGSTNGTRVNGETLRDAERPVAPGDVVEVGDERLRVLDGEATALTPGASHVAPPTVARGALAAEPLRIGRHPSNDIVLDDLNVSRFHAEVRVDGGRAVLRDLGSRNGTLVDGDPVTRPVALGPGAEVAIGPYRLVHDGTAFADVRGGDRALGVDACDLEQTAGDRRLLGPLTLAIEPGELVAIIGRSGSGKSTLLRALAGVEAPAAGRVLVDGEPVARRRTDVGYLPQDEVVHGRLTPREALTYAARLRLPPDVEADALAGRVDAVLEDLALAHRADTRIDRLSGGERKRAGLAVELLGSPGVLHLDEPTTGLDPGLERQTMELLRRLADGSRTIVVVTHTTASLDLCDRLVVMAPGGRVVYSGPPADAPATLGVGSLDAIYDAVEDGAAAAVPVARSPRVRPGGRPRRRSGPAARIALRHALTLTARYARLLVRDRRNLLILLGQVPLLALAIAFLFSGDVFSYARAGNPTDAAQVLFLLTTVAVWLGAVAAAREIVKERAIVARERAVGVGLPAYLASKVLVLGALVAVQVAGLAAIVAALQPMHASTELLVRGLILLLLTGVAAVALGLALSAFARSEDQATSFLPLVLLPQLLFAGAIVPVSKMGPVLDGISHAVVARWSFSGVGTALHMNARLRSDPFDRVHSPYGHSFFTVATVPAAVVILGFAVLALGVVAWRLRGRSG